MSLRHDSLKKFRKTKSKWKVGSWKEYEEREEELTKQMLRDKEPTITNQVRIISGKAKGFKIDIPRKTRPVTDRMKTTIFDVLREDIADREVLDLFAGSGSFGIEALSRGAKDVTFVDASRQAEGVLLENVKHTGFLTETNIIRAKADEYVKEAVENKKEFEIIFVDPPYKLYNKKNTYKMNALLDDIKKLLPGYNNYNTEKFKGVIILKHPRVYPLEKLHLEGLMLLETYNFGMNSATFYIVAKPSNKS